jgi:hypothetical protein
MRTAAELRKCWSGWYEGSSASDPVHLILVGMIHACRDQDRE